MTPAIAQNLADAERHAEHEQLAAGIGDATTANDHRWALRILVNAELAEQEDREPWDPPWCLCARCQNVLYRTHWTRFR